MIDSVRNTVLAIMNKNNYGYMTPSDFNLYAKLAQIDVFRSLFSSYNTAINMENVRKSGVGYADSSFDVQTMIEKFLVVEDLLPGNVPPSFSLVTEYPLYRIEDVICFTTGDELTPKIYNGTAERVSPIKARQLNASLLTKPSKEFPVYTIIGDSLFVYPSFFVETGGVEVAYTRFPAVPKWTYTQVSPNVFVFNQSKSDYQDFELGEEYEDELVVKILQYAGISIRDAEVYAFSKQEQIKTEQ
jgi:hypothetical protein